MFATPIPKVVVPTASTPYDPKVGPVIRPEHWTPEMLAAPLSQSLLANQTDPALFLAARRAKCEAPTDAVVVTEYAGTVHSIAPLNPTTLCSYEDATAMYVRLVELGMNPLTDVNEVPLGGPAQRYDWRGETRRQFAIGPLNVGLLVRRYAVTIKFMADQQTVEEIRAAGMMR